MECPGCHRRVLLGPLRPEAGPCRHCAHRFCSLCSLDPHGPLTCAEFRTWNNLLKDASSGMLQEWFSRFKDLFRLGNDAPARRCPNPHCNVMSQKVDGCLFLICPRCREFWCWNCGDWGGGPSRRPKPHHVFLCTKTPKDITWLDGHSTLKEDARFEFHKSLYESRRDAFEGECHCPMPKITDELAAARLEARRVLRDGAAWRFFEQEDSVRRLFEFAETDLEKLLEDESALRQKTCVQPQDRDRNLAAAVRTQIQALQSYRRHSGRGA